MKLTPRLTLLFIVYAAVLLVTLGLIAYDSGRDALQAATVSELQATALEKEAALNKWVEDKQANISSLAANSTTIEQVSSLLNAAPDSPEAQDAHDMLVSSLLPHQGGFLELSILHPRTGQVLASTNPVEEGRVKEDRPYYIEGKRGPFVQDVYYSTTLQSITMMASSPLQTPQGELVGILTGRLDLEEMNEIISRRTGLHDTNDAYLVNTSSQFVTQPRFLEDPAVLQREIKTEDIDHCLKQESGVVEALDYRAVPAFVVYRWLPDRNLCLVVKMDQTEAFQPIRTFGSTIAAVSTLALLAAAGLAYALARSLTRPILALQRGAARFGRGDLDVRLEEGSRDELGQLAGELNKMAEALSEQHTHLRRRAEQFFNLSPDLLCTLDASQRMQDLNPAWELALGHPPEALRGCLLLDIVHQDDLVTTLDALRRIAGEGSVRFENRCRHSKGNYRWLSWVIISSSQDQLLYAAARDITDRRLAEERVRQRTEELQRSNRELEEFAYVASHDLQDPLRLVSGHVQLLSRRYRGRLDPDADEFIDFAMEGANRLKSLISDLLDYSKIGAGEQTFTSVDMETVFAQVTESLRPMVEENKALVTHDPLPLVLGDGGLMIQLLQNLVENSIKFRGKEAPRIHVGSRQLSEKWLFFVRDNGIGIDPQYTERVFVIFQRLHSRDDYPGNGIGLAICRKIVERHSGHIWVDSEPGKGATFYFTLQPLEGWTTETMQPQTAAPHSMDTIAGRASDLI